LNWCEFGNGAVIVVFTAAAARKYRSPLNPVSLYAAYFFISTIVGAELFRALGLLDVSQHVFDLSQVLSAIYFFAFGLGYLMDNSPIRPPIDALRRFVRPFCLANRKDATRLALPNLMVQFVLIYILLMITSGVGLMWITDTRTAYQLHRAGAGLWWSLASATLYLAYFVFLVRYGTSTKRTFGAALFFSVVAFFLGSKGGSLGYFLLGLFYVHYHIRRVATSMMIAVVALLMFGVVGLQLLQGTAGSLLDTVLYFDYFPNAANFLDSPMFSFQYGRIIFSSIWLYVPRALYPEKPYAYGPATITEWMFPGAAEQIGGTPGLIDWTVPYTDFGVLGVIAAGFLVAWISKAAFESFIHEKRIDTFALMAQLGFPIGVQMFVNAPFPVFWLWFMAQSGLMWLLKVAGRKVSSATPAEKS
jgi:hypothetical protein